MEIFSEYLCGGGLNFFFHSNFPHACLSRPQTVGHRLYSRQVRAHSPPHIYRYRLLLVQRLYDKRRGEDTSEIGRERLFMHVPLSFLPFPSVYIWRLTKEIR